MAKLIFNKDHVNAGGIIGGAYNDAEINKLIGSIDALHTYTAFDITNDQHDGLIKGTKTMSIVNNVPVINDTTIDVGDMLVDRAELETNIGLFKSYLSNALNKKETHTQANYIQSVLDFINAIDLDSLTYPTASLENYLLNNNKYVNLKFF